MPAVTAARAQPRTEALQRAHPVGGSRSRRHTESALKEPREFAERRDGQGPEWRLNDPLTTAAICIDALLDCFRSGSVTTVKRTSMERMPSVHQELEHQHRETKNVVTCAAKHAAEALALELGRSKQILAYLAVEGRATTNDLEGISIDERNSAVFPHHDVAFIYIADDHARCMKRAGCSHQVLRHCDDEEVVDFRKALAPLCGMR